MKSTGLVWLFVFLASVMARGQNPVPLINQPLVPMNVAPGGAMFTLTVNGSGFLASSVVNWNGTALATTFVTSSQLTAAVPAIDIATAGTASVTVINPAPGGSSFPAVFGIASPVSSPTFVSYVQSTNFNAQGIYSLLTADFNGDGKLDLAFVGDTGGAALSNNSHSACIELGNGDGSFQSPACVLLSQPASGQFQNPYWMVVGDFNGDGKLDLAVSNGSDGTDTISILRGNGDGTLQSPTSFPAGSVPLIFAAGDFNRDGALDVAVINQPPSSVPGVSIMLGNGDGTFQSPVAYAVGTGSYLNSIVVADFNRDGNLDLVVSTQGVAIYFLAGTGDGTFQIPVQAQTVDAFTLVSSAADFNEDGILDLLLTDGNLPGASILLGNGDGTFQPPVNYSVNSMNVGVCALAAADLNADGKLDVPFCEGVNTGSSIVSVGGFLLGNGDGTFAAPTGLQMPSPPPLPVEFTSGDFNGDGKTDMVMAMYDNSGPPYPASLLVFLQGSIPLAIPIPSSITFAQQGVGTTSGPQSVTLTNSGAAALTVSGIGIAGTNAADFVQSNNCPVSLAVSASCQISVTFTPTVPGTRNASVSITDNAPGSPQLVTLTGTTPPTALAIPSPTTVTFPSQYVGTTGLPQTITVTNAGTATVTIIGVTTSTSDFGTLSNCTNSVAPGANCTIGVFFDPAASGTRTGALSIVDNAGDSPQTVTLTGAGEDFSMTPSGSSTATVSPGQTASYSLVIAPGGGFNQSISFTCSGTPAGSTCTVPSSITLNGSTSTTVPVTVTTAASSARLLHPRGSSPVSGELAMWLALGSSPAGLVILGAAGRRRNMRGRLLYGVAFLCMISVGITWTGCGGGSSSTGGGGGKSATYSLTVTGTFTTGTTTLSHNTALTLVVQ